ncbi:GNAT family N-acetyltransferase [Altererythrobacter aerius]|uniref:GNAT family N-acetyltransferase n=1 Tax=Tsuneonella aeria TaxID=1837929 RepID=A0A6I4TD48_9SPHN|nr:GNAT family N-acetyltransferase [Tsuneonella aeria]MXO74983.1 GNAT family N-acetyltransferase [Tsuneonella aeria]
MNLRAASPADRDALVVLARQAFADAFGHIYDPRDLAAFLDTSRSPERWDALIHDPQIAVTLAEEAGRLLGYSVLSANEGFAARPAPQPHRPATLGQLYCAREATGRGIGAALMERALADARGYGADAVQLSVYAENFGAQRFYQRYGFAKVADIDFWVGSHRDDEFLYELRLRLP